MAWRRHEGGSPLSTGCDTALSEILQWRRYDIELDADLIEGVRRLAVRHYGDSGDASIDRVAESALEMRLLWQDLVKGGHNEIEEPIVNWKFANGESAGQLPTEIRGWLFKRR